MMHKEDDFNYAKSVKKNKNNEHFLKNLKIKYLVSGLKIFISFETIFILTTSLSHIFYLCLNFFNILIFIKKCLLTYLNFKFVYFTYKYI